MSFSFINELILSVVIGITQGVTEFLPISSTAHIRLVSDLFVGKDIGLATSNFIQFGTLIAIIQFYWLDLVVIAKRLVVLVSKPSQLSIFLARFQRWFKKTLTEEDKKLGTVDIQLAQIIIATIPIVIAALVFRNVVEELRVNIANIGIFLLAGAALIFAAESVYSYRQSKLTPDETSQNKTESNNAEFSFSEVLTIGLFQALAVFPGMSRSGSTLAGALFLGRNRMEAVRFSFLLSIPAIGLASLSDSIKLVNSFFDGKFGFLPSANSWIDKEVNLSVLSLIVGFALSYVIGFACLKWLLKFLSNHTSFVFIIYRILLASVIFAVLFTGLLK